MPTDRCAHRHTHVHVAALDGVRGLAVVAVLLYHLESSPVPGGFLGVSSFFTLSGFLITGLLVGERRRSGTIDLGAFWGRRWRRLLPALLVCLGLVVLGAAVGAYQPSQVDGARADVPWALGYLANWRQLLGGGGYLQDLAAPSPLEHLWSLGIEEQFYVAFPLVVAAVLALSGRAGRGAIAVVCAAAMVASASLAMFLDWSPERVYLGTDTRIAEVLAGSLLAVLLTRGLAGPVPGSRLARAVVVVGPLALGLQLYLWLTVDDSDAGLFTGGLAAHGLLSAVVILGVLVPGPLSTVLSVAPLVAVGRVSYGVYLFHWPLYLWLTEDRTGLDGVALVALRFAATAAIAVLSFRLVEDPVRRRRGRRSITRPLVVGAIAGVLVIAAGALPTTEAVDIAGLDEGGRVEPDAAPVLAAAQPRQVLLVVDERSEELVARLPASTSWQVAGVVRLDCPCDWEQSWAGAVRGDIDAAVVLTDAWDYRPALAVALPGAGATSVEGVDWAANRFLQGVDLLAGPTGRRVVWISWPVDAAGGDREELAQADWSMERRIIGARPGLAHVDLGAAPTAETLAAAIDVQTGAGGEADRAVMVVGDSVASSMAAGLQAWGQDHGVVVWDNARGGCGVVRDGRRVALDGSLASEDDCRPWREGWAPAAAQWGADLVVVLVGVWDVNDRELPGGDEVVGPGDPAWDRYVLDEYVAAVDELAAAGIPVVLATPPCMGYEGDRVPGGVGSGLPVFADDRQVQLRDQLLEAFAGRSDARVYDLFVDLCPDGTFVEQSVDGELVRPDGVHFGGRGAIQWAEQHAAELVGSP